MLDRTDEEIQEKINTLWDYNPDHSWDKITVEVNRDTKDVVFITVSKMYEAPGLSFLKIQALAKFFDTLNVETESEFRNGGCDTCDYGSSYGFKIKVSPGAPYKEIE